MPGPRPRDARIRLTVIERQNAIQTRIAFKFGIAAKQRRWTGIAAVDGLRQVTAFVLLFAAAPVFATTVRDWAAQIHEASSRFRIPEEWIRDVMRVESDGRTEVDGQPITSSSGAMGLMQLMPGTWREMRRVYRLGTDPYDPHDNVIAGVAYLRAMIDQFGYPAALAAYNAGPGRLAQFLAAGRPLPPETLVYLERATSWKSRARAGSRATPASRGRKISSKRVNSRKLFVVAPTVPVGEFPARKELGKSVFVLASDVHG